MKCDILPSSIASPFVFDTDNPRGTRVELFITKLCQITCQSHILLFCRQMFRGSNGFLCLA